MVRLALLLWFAATEPREPPPPPATAIELRWLAPDECPDRDAFLEEMSVIAGRRLASSPAAALAVDGWIEASSGGYVLQLRLRSAEVEELRSLEAPACEALVSAGSLVVVTRLLGAIPPPPEDRTVAPDETPTAAPAATAALVPLPPAADAPPPSLERDDPIAPYEPGPPPKPRPPDRQRLHGTFVVLGGAALGLGPRLAGTVRAGAGLRWSSARIEAFAMHVLATQTQRGDVPGVRASLTGAGALGCWAPGRGRLDVPLCAGIHLGAAVGSGIGPLAMARVVRQLWIGLPLEAGIAWAPIPRLALRALLGSTIGLRRPGFHVDAAGDRIAIARAWPVGLHAMGGVELRLP